MRFVTPSLAATLVGIGLIGSALARAGDFDRKAYNALISDADLDKCAQLLWGIAGNLHEEKFLLYGPPLGDPQFEDYRQKLRRIAEVRRGGPAGGSQAMDKEYFLRSGEYFPLQVDSGNHRFQRLVVTRYEAAHHFVEIYEVRNSKIDPRSPPIDLSKLEEHRAMRAGLQKKWMDFYLTQALRKPWNEAFRKKLEWVADQVASRSTWIVASTRGQDSHPGDIMETLRVVVSPPPPEGAERAPLPVDLFSDGEVVAGDYFPADSVLMDAGSWAISADQPKNSQVASILHLLRIALSPARYDPALLPKTHIVCWPDPAGVRLYRALGFKPVMQGGKPVTFQKYGTDLTLMSAQPEDLVKILSHASQYRSSFTEGDAKALIELFEDISVYEHYPDVTHAATHAGGTRRLLDIDLN